MFIEDLIRKTSNYNFFNFGASVSYTRNLDTREVQMLDSLCEQLDRGNNLTEKQAIVALRLLRKCKNELRPEHPKIDDILENPTWKNPFRVLSTAKRFGIEQIEISPNVRSKHIYVEFPYDHEIVETFRKRNGTVHEAHRGSWNNELRKWVFTLSETTILWLGDYLKGFGFEADEEFTDLYNEADQIRNSIENHLPMLTLSDGKYEIKNLPVDVDTFSPRNLTEALFLAREYGVTCWDDEIESRISQEVNPHTRKIIESTIRNRPWFNSEEIKISDFATDLLTYSNAVLVVIPGGSELTLTRKWVNFANSLGIKNSEMSVMFRLPNNQAEFNQYVKDELLNNPVDSSTKIVFVNTKITKPVIKSNVKFDAVINLGYYNYMHFTMETMVENAPILVYYNIKEPAKTRKWLPHEL